MGYFFLINWTPTLMTEAKRRRGDRLFFNLRAPFFRANGTTAIWLPASLVITNCQDSSPRLAASGGNFVIRTDKITSLDGNPPARFIIIKFDSVEKAQAWHNSAAQKEIPARVGISLRTLPVRECLFVRLSLAPPIAQLNVDGGRHSHLGTIARLGHKFISASCRELPIQPMFCRRR